MEISTRTEDGELVLCASSIYNQKFYLNKEFSKLPDEIKDELHAMCGAFTQEVGGIFMLVFDDAGNLKPRSKGHTEDADSRSRSCRMKRRSCSRVWSCSIRYLYRVLTLTVL